MSDATRPVLALVPPATEHRDTFLCGLRELRDEGLPWWAGLDLEAIERDFAAFVADKLADATRPSKLGVTRTHLWALVEGRFVGRLAIQHELTAALRVEGGHLGYDTVPSARGRGVATEMLRRALPVARGLGLTEVLLTCDDTNLASICVIERNGGVLRETRALGPGRPPKRYYWITLS
jgi:predicted acetyltransferase